MGLAQGHKAVTRVIFEPATPSVSSQALQHCAVLLKFHQNKIKQDPRNRAFYLRQSASWHNTDKVVTACLYGRESRCAQRKNTTSCYLFLFYFIIHFLLFDNGIADMFIHTAHAYAHILLHKMDGSKRNILKGTVKGNTPPPRQYHAV